MFLETSWLIFHWGFAPNPIHFFVLIQKSKQKKSR